MFYNGTTTLIDKGYFLCATNKTSYINKGNKPKAADFETYQDSSYMAGNIFPVYDRLSAEKVTIQKNIFFNWNGIILNKKKTKNKLLEPKNKKYYAWLTPVII